MIDDATIWNARTFVYRFFTEQTVPPTAEQTAAACGLSVEAAEAVYRELDRCHLVFLQAGTTGIRIANPFSAVPTAFRVHAAGKRYFANCAWDALGIPAALHSDARIDAACAGTGEPLTLTVSGGRVAGSPAVAHVLVPFARWYDDMVFT